MAYSRPPLRGAELAILKLLWKNGKMTRRSLQEALAGVGRNLVDGTIQKYLARLESKGYIVHNRRAHAHSFRASISAEQYAEDLVRSLLDDPTTDSLVPFLIRILKHQKPLPKECRRIRHSFRPEPKKDQL